jgi:hypothetical protein
MANMNRSERLQENLSILKELQRFFARKPIEDMPGNTDVGVVQGQENISHANALKANGDPLASLMDELAGNRLKISSALDVVQEVCNSNKLIQFHESNGIPGHHHNVPALVNPKGPFQQPPNMAGDDYRGCLLAKNLNNYQIHHGQGQFLNFVDSSLLHQNLHLMHGQPFMNYHDWRYHADCEHQSQNQSWNNSQLVKCTPKTGFSLNTESNVSFEKVVMLPPVVPSQTFPSGMAEFVLDVTRQKQRKSEQQAKKHRTKLRKCVKRSIKHTRRYSSSSLEFKC